MANKAGHRRFGNVRQLPSGRFQARYLAPDGRLRSHPETFSRKSDAERVLTLIEAQLIGGDWTRMCAGGELTCCLAVFRQRWRPRPTDCSALS